MRRLESASSILHETKDIPAEGLKLDSDAYVVSCAWADYYAAEGNLDRAVALYEQLLGRVMAANRKNSMTCETRPSSHFCMKSGWCLSAHRRDCEGKRHGSTPVRPLAPLDKKLPNNTFIRRNLKPQGLNPARNPSHWGGVTNPRRNFPQIPCFACRLLLFVFDIPIEAVLNRPNLGCLMRLPPPAKGGGRIRASKETLR